MADQADADLVQAEVDRLMSHPPLTVEEILAEMTAATLDTLRLLEDP